MRRGIDEKRERREERARRGGSGERGELGRSQRSPRALVLANAYTSLPALAWFCTCSPPYASFLGFNSQV